ncbi:paraquat-inducible protein A [Halocatena pleomorpha]|uniref:Uncharacterized protein n=1 Tax=Halocatena pleomorpha TaxID=1785090 RepID=A0A3P3RAJ8_9EURY|nr:hypothetical protein [Halocatena pleomorpha]RRJ29938.1 hypothetical protein EIK79_11315 [Halocatena pleomorpha]
MTDRATEGHTTHQISCPDCDRTFPAHRAPYIDYRGEEIAEYTCPGCRDTIIHHPPEQYIERPPAIVDHTILTDETDQPIARVFFEDGAWLQYRATDRRWVREELLGKVPRGILCLITRDDLPVSSVS